MIVELFFLFLCAPHERSISQTNTTQSKLTCAIMKRIQTLREPYIPPKGECFVVHCGISLIDSFSKEDLDGIESGPDLTPRDEELYPDLL